MSEIVVDASLASSWCFPDEKTEYTHSVLAAVSSSGVDACVPTLWAYEMHNVVLMGVRRKRITISHGEQFLASLKELGFRLIDPPSYDRVFKLAGDYGLTFYDAAYLDLALRKTVRLASLDNALNQAALKANIPLFHI